MALETINNGETGEVILNKLNGMLAELYAANAGAVPSRTGGVVAFDASSIYNTPAAPSSFSSFDLTEAVANTEVVGYFNNESMPSFGTGTYVIGNWNPNALNIVRFIYKADDDISISIISAQGTQANVDARLSVAEMTADVEVTSTTATDVTGLALPVQANTHYRVKVAVRLGCSGTGGGKLAFSYPSGTMGLARIGRAATATAFTGQGGNVASGTLQTDVFQNVANSSGFAIYEGKLKVGATGGTFQVQAAIVTAGQTLTVYENISFLELFKI